MSINKTLLAGLLVSCFAMTSAISTSVDARGGTGGSGGGAGKAGRSDGAGMSSRSSSGCSSCGSHSSSSDSARSFSRYSKSKQSCPQAISRGIGTNPDRGHGGDLMRKQNDRDVR